MFGPIQLFVLADILAYLLIILLLWRTQTIKVKSNFNFSIAVLLFMFICVYAYYDTDFFHYEDAVEDIMKGYNTHMEDVYIDLIHWVGGSSFAFRCIVWGFAILACLLIGNSAQLYNPLFIFVLVSVFVTKFAYGRVSLAMSLCFLSIPLMLVRSKKILKVLLGLVCLSCSFFFHKSAVFGILVVLLSIFTIKINKKWMYLYLFLFPLFVVAIDRVIIPYVFSLDSQNFEYINVESVQSNMEAEEMKSIGLGLIVSRMLEWTPYYLIVFLYIKLIKKGYFSCFPSIIKVFANCSFFIITISTALLLTTSANMSILFYRLLYFSIIPNSVLLAYCLENNYFRRYSKRVVIIGIIGVLYRLSYSYYLSYFL